MADAPTAPLSLTPRYYERIWGGSRLQGRAGVGEAWLAGEANLVESGPHGGRTLGELAAEHREALLGEGAPAGDGFPLLIKLLDTADWLSVQVHPDDELAAASEGPRTRGKTEAWHVLEAHADAEALIGAQVSPQEFESAIGTDQLPPCLGRYPLERGGTLFVPAGAPHALGPGALVYEIQQHSDITYRGYDWGRDRGPLDVEKFRRVSDVAIPSRNFVLDQPEIEDEPLVRCDHFTLERQAAGAWRAVSHSGSFEIITLVRGRGAVTWDDGTLALRPYDTVVVPAACNGYTLALEPAGEALIASPGGIREVARRAPRAAL